MDEDSHYDWSLYVPLPRLFLVSSRLEFSLGWKDGHAHLPLLPYLLFVYSVRKVRRSLSSLRAAGDVRGVIGVLDVCLRPSFAGVEGVRLYSETFYGTKDLVEGESASLRGSEESWTSGRRRREAEEDELTFLDMFSFCVQVTSMKSLSLSSSFVRAPKLHWRRRRSSSSLPTRSVSSTPRCSKTTRRIDLTFLPSKEFRIICPLPEWRCFLWILPYWSCTRVPQRWVATESRDWNECWSFDRRVSSSRPSYFLLRDKTLTRRFRLSQPHHHSNGR